MDSHGSDSLALHLLSNSPLTLYLSVLSGRGRGGGRKGEGGGGEQSLYKTLQKPIQNHNFIELPVVGPQNITKTNIGSLKLAPHYSSKSK